MLLFSTSPCDSLLGSAFKQNTSFTSSRTIALSRPSSRDIFSQLQQYKLLPQTSTTILEPTNPTYASMDQYSYSPRSPPFSPSLNAIEEVIHEDHDEDHDVSPTTEHAAQSPGVLLSDPINMAEPTVSMTTSKSAIIQSPSQRSRSTMAVSGVLRKVLAADRQRRIRILRVYLKAIIFLKYLWAAHERYGTVMLTSGMYTQR
jgi:hypothetical protein